MYTIDFKFVDRGAPVPLQTKLTTSRSGEPKSLVIKGNTSRFSTIDDSITIHAKSISLKVGDSIYNQPVKAIEFPVGGYSPGTVQAALLRYWKQHGEPQHIPLLPTGEVNISRYGQDTLLFMGKNLHLNKFVLKGLIWGNEIIWTDDKFNLICLITNDAEGDKLEIMQEAYESLLPELIKRAADFGMKLFSASIPVADSAAKTIIITGGNIPDLETGSVLTNGMILTKDGLIKQVDAAGSISIPSNAIVIDAKGKTVLPGLWDMHAHFEQAEWGPAYLAAGVTTVRDCGNEFGYINAIKTAIDSHRGIGPYIIKAGIIDGPGPLGLGIVRASIREEAVRAVDTYKDSGFAQIKIYSSVQPAIVRAITDEAHRLGLTVTGHIPNGMSTKAGIDSGMDQVNHIQYVYAMMKKKKDKSIDLTDSSNVAALEYLKAKHTVIDPTLGVFEMIFRSVKDNILEMEPGYYKLPVPLQAIFSNMGMPESEAKVYKPMFEGMLSLVKALHDKGIPIVAGTDMGFPGYSLDRELELYVAAGLSPLEALQTATLVPARVMNLSKESGSVKAGMNADIIIVDGNPLKNIRDLRNVDIVIKNGQQYDPKKLHRLVGFTD